VARNRGPRGEAADTAATAHRAYALDPTPTLYTQVWLEIGGHGEKRQKPLQLPIVLQVLLSQAHRVRALCLLARFLDMGSWAVNHALSVGIFPYVLKLLQVRKKSLKSRIKEP